jgi:hypothetical protein
MQRFEESVSTERFNIATIFTAYYGEVKYSGFKTKLEEHFSKAVTKHILQSILRFAFYIEPVKQPKIESTKFSVRWSPSLTDDPRFCSFANCNLIFEKLLNGVIAHLANEDDRKFLEIISNHTLIAYELNIDYINRIQDGLIHTVDNIDFFWSENTKQAYYLRQYLLNPNNHYHIKFFTETYSKIAVKSFLTDRVLTGGHKTNREKRWECHPNSVHFALRKDCLAIEAKLVNQICHFEGFPPELRSLLTENHIITFGDEITKCPITLDKISFEKFQTEILNPTHGKSSFQVGHLHPLKSLGENAHVGHTVDNISWISSKGNRIQGELSVDETRALILKIIANYKAEGLTD